MHFPKTEGGFTSLSEAGFAKRSTFENDDTDTDTG